MKIHVLHEYGGWRHFLPLRALEKEGHIDLSLNVINVPRRIAGALKRRSWSNFVDIRQDAKVIWNLLHSAGGTIVVGLAPHHSDVFLLERLQKQHRLILFTSWPSWDTNEVVHHPGNHLLRRRWLRLLQDIEVVCVTPGVADAVTNYGARATVIPHAVSIAEPDRIEPRARARRFIYVGRLTEEKGIRYLLDAIAGIPHALEFHFVGSGPLAELVRSAGFKDSRIIYHGQLAGAALDQAYARADVLILPSYKVKAWEELFGIVIIEAFASGLPAIVTDCIGPKSIIRNESNGWLINQRDPIALRQTITRVAESPEMFQACSRMARHEAEEIYAVDVIAKKWRQVLAQSKS